MAAPRVPIKNLDKVKIMVENVKSTLYGSQQKGKSHNPPDPPLGSFEQLPSQPSLHCWDTDDEEENLPPSDLDQAPARKAQKVSELQNFSEDWARFFAEQESFWKGKEPSQVDKCRPPDCPCDVSKLVGLPTCPTEKLQLGQLVLDLLDKSTTTDNNMHQFLRNTSVSGKLKGALKLALKEEEEGLSGQGRDETAVYLYHQNDKPPSRSTYDPQVDAKQKQLALIKLDEAGSSFGRCWEIALINKTHGKDKEKMVDVTYYQPGRKENDVEKGVDMSKSWPDKWFKDRTLVPMTVKVNGRTSLYQQSDIPLANVVYSFFLTKGNKVPAGVQDLLTEQIDRVVRSTKGEAVGFEVQFIVASDEESVDSD